MCAGHAPELEEKTSFVGRWMDILRPGYERVKELPEESRIRALEQEGVVVSLENLMSFPFVKSSVEAGNISLHGLWINIETGTVNQYIAESKTFEAV